MARNANYNLSDQTRAKLDEFFTRVEKTYGGKIGKQFNVTPAIENVLIQKVREIGSPFINSGHVKIITVPEITGKKVNFSLTGSTASRTDTSGNGRRSANNFLGSDGDDYSLVQINNDALILYALLDQWRAKGDIAPIYNELLNQEKANSILKCGWYGTSRADTTDIALNPNLEDVNTGWLQHMRTFDSGSHYLDGVTIGQGGDFETLDALVAHVKREIPNWLRNNLWSYVSDDVVGIAEGHYYEQTTDMASEKLVLNQSNRTILETWGALPAITPPFYPEGSLLICPMGSLQYYIQEGSTRRTVRDAPDRNGVEDFNSHNADHRLEDMRACFLVENITAAPAL